MRENSDLHRTIEELNQRYDERLRFKDDTIQGLTEQIADLEGALRSKDKATRMSGSELEELRRENGQLRDQLLDKYTKELSDEALGREISNVRDPGSFQALKSILSRLERQKQENQSLKREIDAAGSLQRSLGDASSKLKQKDSEIKTLQAEIKKLMIQNEFLLREYEFLQKKHNQGVKRKFGNDEVVQPGADGHSDAKTSGVLEEICTILKIKDQSKLISSVKMIEEAYRLLPGLQNTVETIFKTVSENPVFDTPLNSYDDLIDAVENWGHNLADYQSLVNGLLETLEIDNEEQKTVSFIVSSANGSWRR